VASKNLQKNIKFINRNNITAIKAAYTLKSIAKRQCRIGIHNTGGTKIITESTSFVSVIGKPSPMRLMAINIIVSKFGLWSAGLLTYLWNAPLFSAHQLSTQIKCELAADAQYQQRVLKRFYLISNFSTMKLLINTLTGQGTERGCLLLLRVYTSQRLNN
jgi:hypothetical protein